MSVVAPSALLAIKPHLSTSAASIDISFMLSLPVEIQRVISISSGLAERIKSALELEGTL